MPTVTRASTATPAPHLGGRGVRNQSLQRPHALTMLPAVKTLVASALLLVGCADLELSTSTHHVIGGKRSSAGEFPGVGALMLDFGGGMPQFGCTGTLIAPDAVLTAAHCLDPDLIGDALPGFTLELEATPSSRIYKGRKAIPHDRFTLDVEELEGLDKFYDIGVLLLADPVTEVAPVPMPRPSDIAELVAGMSMEIAGYGLTSPGGSEGGVLHDAKTQLIALNDTELQVGNGSPMPQNCQGDSGGPGFALVGGTRRVIGVVSRSFMGAECVTGGGDTRVDAYLPFIHGNVTSGVPCGSGLAEPCAVDPEDPNDPSQPGHEHDDDHGDGGCSAGVGGSSGALVLLAAAGLVVRRRRR